MTASLKRAIFIREPIDDVFKERASMLMPMIAAFHLLTYRIARSVTRSSVKKGGETHLTGRRTFEALKFEARSFAVEAMTREARRRCAVIRPADACLRRKE